MVESGWCTGDVGKGDDDDDGDAETVKGSARTGTNIVESIPVRSMTKGLDKRRIILSFIHVFAGLTMLIDAMLIRATKWLKLAP